MDFSLKRAKTKHFCIAINALLIFEKILQVDKFKGADFKYDNSVLKFWPKYTKTRSFCCQILAFLFFDKILQVDKFEGAD